MIYLLILATEFLLLWLLSRAINRRIIGRLPVWLYAVLFLPGTFFHELAHLLMAKILFVKVGKFTLLPRKHEKELVLGSISIEQTNAVKRLLIGIAPIILGGALIILAIFVSLEHDLHKNAVAIIAIGYLVFVIGNSMFSSKKDLEGAWKVITTAIILGVIAYLLGIRVNISLNNYEFIKTICYYLLIPIGLNSLIVAILSKIPYR